MWLSHSLSTSVWLQMELFSLTWGARNMCCIQMAKPWENYGVSETKKTREKKIREKKKHYKMQSLATVLASPYRNSPAITSTVTNFTMFSLWLHWEPAEAILRDVSNFCPFHLYEGVRILETPLNIVYMWSITTTPVTMTSMLKLVIELKPLLAS